MNKKKISLHIFCDQLMEIMPQLMRGFASYEHHSLIRGTITPVQYWGLECLLSHGAVSMKGLAGYLGISKPSATALINRLINQGLVMRQKEVGDRRIVRIALSAKGLNLTRNIKQRRYQALSRVFSRISENDRDEYLRLLHEIDNALKELSKRGN